MGPQVLRSKSTATEYRSVALMTRGTWTPAKRPHKHTHMYTHKFHWGICHICSHPTSTQLHWCLGSLLVLSNTVPPGKDLNYQSPSCQPHWTTGPLMNPAIEIKQPFLSAVKVCCCLVLLWTLACEGWLSGLGEEGKQTSSVKVNVRWSSAADSGKHAPNWLLQGGTWQINVDSRAVNFTAD